MYSAKVDMRCYEKDVLESNFQLDDNYLIMSGDERIYQLLGDNTIYPFDKLVHDDDKESFFKFINSDNTEEPLMIRCLVKSQNYKWILLNKTRISYNNTIRNVELKAQNVVAQCNRFDSYFMKMKKYRCVINQITDKLFEYDFNTGIFTIYWYKDDRSEIIEKDMLSDWKSRMLRLGFVEEDSKRQFDMLCQNIENGSDSFSLIFPSSIMSKGERKETLSFRGETIKEGLENVLVIGIITELGTRMKGKQIIVTSEEDGTKDSATGILNKKAIQDEIREIINNKRGSQISEPMYLIILDIDDFKLVNDTYGHYFGDEVILSFAQDLKRVVGSRGLVGRIGGDEFLVFLRDDASEDDARNILKTVRKNLEVKLGEIQPGYRFTVSAGLSTYDKDSDNYEELFKIADTALYIAKGKGKDRYVIFDKDKHSEYLKNTLESGRTGYADGFMKPCQKYDLAADLMLMIANKGKKAAIEVFYELIDKFNLHGITVYKGDNLENCYSVGHYNNPLKDANYIKDEMYIELFDEYNTNRINNVASLAVDFPDIFVKLKNANICSLLQILIYEGDKIQAMFQFDTFGENRRKWNDDDINVVRMVVKTLEGILK